MTAPNPDRADPNMTVKVRTARKAHRCEECHRTAIGAGHRYQIHTAFPGHDVLNPDRPIQLKRCMGCAIERDVIAAHTGDACGTFCCGTEPCARPFGHTGDCSCRQDAVDAARAWAAS